MFIFSFIALVVAIFAADILLVVMEHHKQHQGQQAHRGPSPTIPPVMRAVVMTQKSGGPETLAVHGNVSVPLPHLDHGEILVKVSATALNRADSVQRQGRYAPPPGASQILGLEAAGVVVQAPAPVPLDSVFYRQHSRILNQLLLQRFNAPPSLHAKVTCLLDGGGYAEYVVAHRDHCLVVEEDDLNNHFNLTVAAAFPEAYLTGYQSMRYGGLARSRKTTAREPAMNVLIHAGASGVGTALCQMVRAFGATPLITASKRKIADERIARVCGVHRFERDNSATADADPRWVSEIEAKIGINNVSLCVDPVVSSGYLRGDIRLLAIDGTVVIIATMAGNVEKLDFNAFFRKRAVIRGSTLRSRSWEYKAELVRDFRENYWSQFVSRSRDTNSLPVIDRIMPLEKVQEAHRMLDAAENIGKIVLTV